MWGDRVCRERTAMELCALILIQTDNARVSERLLRIDGD
jgi:hypothetical protein